MTHTLTQKYILFLILLYTKRNLKYFLDFSKDRFHPHSIVTTPPSLYLTTWRIYTGGWLRDWGSWLDSKWQTPVSCETVTGEWRVMAAAESWSTDWAVFCLLDWSELTVQCLAGQPLLPPLSSVKLVPLEPSQARPAQWWAVSTDQSPLVAVLQISDFTGGYWDTPAPTITPATVRCGEIHF